jgi:hypothetical protein
MKVSKFIGYHQNKWNKMMCMKTLIDSCEIRVLSEKCNQRQYYKIKCKYSVI